MRTAGGGTGSTFVCGGALANGVNFSRMVRHMADDKLILNVDDDWKRQAQEEKRKLAEQEQKAKAVAPPAAGAAGGAAPAGEAEDGGAHTPFAGLVQTLLTQGLIYLGGMAGRGGRPTLNLDAARSAVDMLGALDEKTHGNLSVDEQQMLDTALYEVRNRFVSVASQMIGP